RRWAETHRPQEFAQRAGNCMIKGCPLFGPPVVEPRNMHATSVSATKPVSMPRLVPASTWPLAPFDFHTPTRVVFGPGTLNRLGELASELGDTRVLVVTDPGLKAAGHPQRAVASLKAAGLEAFVFDEVEEN